MHAVVDDQGRTLRDRVRDAIAAAPSSSTMDILKVVGGAEASVRTYIAQWKRQNRPSAERDKLRETIRANPLADYDTLVEITGATRTQCRDMRRELVEAGEVTRFASGAPSSDAAGPKLEETPSLRAGNRGAHTVGDLIHGLRHALSCLDADCDRCLKIEELLESNAFGEAGVVADALDELVALRAAAEEMCNTLMASPPAVQRIQAVSRAAAGLGRALSGRVDLSALPLEDRVRLVKTLAATSALPTPGDAALVAKVKELETENAVLKAEKRELHLEANRLIKQRDRAEAATIRGDEAARLWREIEDLKRRLPSSSSSPPSFNAAGINEDGTA